MRENNWGVLSFLTTGILGLFLNLNLSAQPVPIPVPAPGANPVAPAQKPKLLPPPKPGEKRGPDTPNIILIVADDLGWGDLGSYGQQLIKTPYLDQLAAEGMRFTQFYAGAPLGNASRCALLTGKHTGHSYIRGNRPASLRTVDTVIPMYLQGNAQYETIALGKWNLGSKGTPGEPFKKGFRHWLGFVDQTHANNHYPTYVWRYEPGIRGVNSWNGDVAIQANARGQRNAYSTDLLTKAALNAIRIYKPDWYKHYRPFFLYLSYTAPHANNQLAQKAGNGMEVPTDFPYSGEKWPRPERNKAAMITRLDTAVGQIMAKLKEYKLDEDTLILFTSDNGPHQEGGNNPAFFRSAGPFKGIKGNLYEGGLRVPMIARWTGNIKPNTVSEEPFAHWDVLPTLLSAARVSKPREIDGVSFLPTLLGREQFKKHDFLYWEMHEYGSQQAARKGDWKVIRPAPGKALELYNLKRDPTESQNVASLNAEVVTDFENFLRTARTRSVLWPITQPKETASRR